jgi:uncharacterized protein (DUF488 family)
MAHTHNPRRTEPASIRPASKSDLGPIYTIGHSTRTIPEFTALLAEAVIELLVDVRSIPRSRTNPQFNRDVLPVTLAELGVGYEHIAELGGRRHRPRGAPPSPNTFRRVDAFRNYADYAATADFNSGLGRLLELANHRRTAIMCAEAVWWRCHRRIISDYLLAREIPVLHIMAPHKIEPAALTPDAHRLENGTLVYPG